MNNQARIIGVTDSLPPCPLYLHYYEKEAEITAADEFPTSKISWYHVTTPGRTENPYWSCCDERSVPLMTEMRKNYRVFWGRDVDTGKLI